MLFLHCGQYAGMMELVDMRDLKSLDGYAVRVQIPLPAP